MGQSAGNWRKFGIFKILGALTSLSCTAGCSSCCASILTRPLLGTPITGDRIGGTQSGRARGPERRVLGNLVVKRDFEPSSALMFQHQRILTRYSVSGFMLSKESREDTVTSPLDDCRGPGLTKEKQSGWCRCCAPGAARRPRSASVATR